MTPQKQHEGQTYLTPAPAKKKRVRKTQAPAPDAPAQAAAPAPDAPVMIDMKQSAALAELIGRPAPALKQVVIMCDRAKMLWRIEFEDGSIEFRTEAIITEVSFTSWKDDKVKIGCGATGFTGVASGKLLPESRPLSEPSERVKVLFSRAEGKFYGYCSSGRYVNLSKSAFLVLGEGCQGAVFEDASGNEILGAKGAPVIDV